MAKFCGKCGGMLDNEGKCPNCDKEKIISAPQRIDNSSAKNDTNTDKGNVYDKKQSKKETKVDKKSEKKAVKKARKKEKRAQMSFGKKIKRFFIKLMAVVLALVIVAGAGACVLVYFEKIDIPFISSIFYKLNKNKPPYDDDEMEKYIEELKNINLGDEIRKESNVLEAIEASSSNQVVNEADTIKQFKERGFTDLDIVTHYSMDGSFNTETVIGNNPQEKHPLYSASYTTSTGFNWTVYCCNGEWSAIPISYLFSGMATCENTVCETEYIMSYDSLDNSFYKIIPNESIGIITKVQRIDAATLNSLAEKEFCIS